MAVLQWNSNIFQRFTPSDYPLSTIRSLEWTEQGSFMRECGGVARTGKWERGGGHMTLLSSRHLRPRVSPIKSSAAWLNLKRLCRCIVVWPPITIITEIYRCYASKNVAVWKQNPFTIIITRFVLNFDTFWIRSLPYLYKPLSFFPYPLTLRKRYR